MLRLRAFLTMLFLAAVCAIPAAVAQDLDNPYLTPDRRALLEARAARQAQIDRLMMIKRAYSAEILALPGVTGFGIGDTAGRLVFRVMVDPDKEIPELPRSIDGVPVEVKRRAPVRLLDSAPNCNGNLGPPCHSQTLPLPVEMGNSGSRSGMQSSGACTLGFKACDLESGRTVFVTNSHCNETPTCTLPFSGLWTQPGWADAVSNQNTCINAGTCSAIGTILSHAAPSCQAGAANLTDATKIVSTSAQTLMAVREIGIPTGQGQAQMFDSIQKSGRTTGLSAGAVTTVGLDVPVDMGDLFCCGPLTMTDQIEFTSAPGIEGGDSGSALISDSPDLGLKVVGLIFGSSTDAQGNSFGYANRISNVLPALGLSLNFFTCVSDCIATSAAQQMGSEGDRALRLAREYRDGPMAASPAGLTLRAIYDQYSGQAVRLAQADPALMRATVSLLNRLAPKLEYLAPGAPVSISPEDLAALDDLLARYGTVASRDMQSALRVVRRTLADPEARRDLYLALR